VADARGHLAEHDLLERIIKEALNRASSSARCPAAAATG
jgi:hypothetical protein